ncbi:restriction endonuclease subunit S [Pseudomonas viridiflava]|uniref:restriction endonuclease subunit S n=1 Tax=Pseudomonas viridiflava TaxID=33069 RepID=UPI0017869770|nr:restriction endonuclease subunit S [Pseudomonas viridiflava]MBD8187466.1 restriction endonuclease subunit S [Pseudomonas viridiflava]
MAVKAGYKLTEVGVIPEEWVVKPFGELFAFRNGVNADKDSYGQGVRFINVLEPITYSHIHGPEIQGQVTLPVTVSVSYEVRRGDVLFNRTSETQEEVGLAATYLGSERVVFGGFVIRGRPTDGNLDPVYSGYALRAPCIRSQIIPMGQGAIRANIGQSNLSLVVAPVPPLSEQRAIATALSDVDALLGALERLIAKKRDLKQAAMQQLLTGLTRLPGFHGEWGVTRLGNVLKFQVGCPFSSMFFNEKGQGVRLVKNRDLKSDDQIFHYSGKYDQSFLVSNGDVLIGMDGDFLPCRWSKGAALLNQRVGRVVPLAGLDLAFSFYYLLGPLKEIEFATASTTVKHLSHGDIEGIEKPLPSLTEQTAIAAVLTDMDAELTALEQRLAKTRVLKQGMMQELLTGRTRLL